MSVCLNSFNCRYFPSGFHRSSYFIIMFILYSLWIMNYSCCRWTVSCTRSVGHLTQCEVTKNGHCCLTARWDASCVHCRCAALHDGVQCSWMQLVWDCSCRTVADMLRHSCLFEATFLQLDTSRRRATGRQAVDKGLDSFPLVSCLSLHIVTWVIFPPQFPAYHFL